MLDYRSLRSSANIPNLSDSKTKENIPRGKCSKGIVLPSITTLARGINSLTLRHAQSKVLSKRHYSVQSMIQTLRKSLCFS